MEQSAEFMPARFAKTLQWVCVLPPGCPQLRHRHVRLKVSLDDRLDRFLRCIDNGIGRGQSDAIEKPVDLNKYGRTVERMIECVDQQLRTLGDEFRVDQLAPTDFGMGRLTL